MNIQNLKFSNRPASLNKMLGFFFCLFIKYHAYFDSFSLLPCICISKGDAIHLSHGTSVVLRRCPLMLEIMYGGIPEAFLLSERWKERYMNFIDSVRLDPPPQKKQKKNNKVHIYVYA